jgi:hypothetical protein
MLIAVLVAFAVGTVIRPARGPSWLPIHTALGIELDRRLSVAPS